MVINDYENRHSIGSDFTDLHLYWIMLTHCLYFSRTQCGLSKEQTYINLWQTRGACIGGVRLIAVITAFETSILISDFIICFTR